MNQQKDMTGVLFKNDKREKDSQPQAKGSAMIDGVEYWVSAWTNTDKNGNKYQSLKFAQKEQAHREGMAQAVKAAEPENFEDDELPF